jgi:hypothetical protein
MPTKPIRELGPETLIHKPESLRSSTKSFMSKQPTVTLLRGFAEPIKIKDPSGTPRVIDGNHRVNELYQRYQRGEIADDIMVPYEEYVSM